MNPVVRTFAFLVCLLLTATAASPTVAAGIENLRPSISAVDCIPQSNPTNLVLPQNPSGPLRDDPWDLRWSLSLADRLNDNYIQGVAFADDRYFIAGQHNGEPAIYILDREGDLIESFRQPGDDDRGMNDLAWDGELLWGISGSMVYGFTTEGEVVHNFNGPYAMCKNIAWDSDWECLWLSAVTTNVACMSREGELIRSIRASYNGEQARMYGLGYYPDDPEGHPVYVYCKERNTNRIMVLRMNPNDGDIQFVTYLEHEAGGDPMGIEITNEYDFRSWVMLAIANNPPADGGDRLDVWQIADIGEGDEEAQIDVSPEEIDFGAVRIDESADMTLTISNTGDANLIVSDIFTEEPFSAAFDWRFTVEPGEEQEVVVTFTPEGAREYEGTLTIISNAADNEEYPVHLSGIGYIQEGGGHYRWIRTDSNASILINGASLLGEELPVGDEISVFTPDGICAGAEVWNGEQVGLAAFGDEENTELVEGFQVDEEMSFRIWDWDSETEYRGVPHFVQGDDVFHINGLSVIDLLEGLNFCHWQPHERTDNNHSLLVQGATLDDEPLAVDDEIAVVTPGGMLAGWVVWPAEGQIRFPVWGDEAQTEDVVEGFQNEEEFTFKVWDHIADAEWDAEPDFIEGPHVYNAGGLTVLRLAAFRCCDLEVSLLTGWNMISINVAPPAEWYDENEQRGPSIVRMMSDLVNRGLLILIKDQDGNFYAPEYGYNGIDYWNLTQGYQVKLTQAAVTTWSGYPIEFDADIPLERGWNIIAYYPAYELPCRHPAYLPFSSILDYVEIAKDADGDFSVPAYQYSGMAPWRQTQGYQIKVTQEVVLNYPPEPEHECLAAVEPVESDPVAVVTPFNMSVLLNDIAGEWGDNAQVRALNASGVPVGEGLIDEDGRCGLAVWGDDSVTPEWEGLLEGEAFTLGLFDESTGQTTALDVSILTGRGLVYKTDGLTVVEAAVRSALPSEYYLAEPYPNPFNAATCLTFGLPEAGWVKLSIFDLNGRLVDSIFNSELSIGVHTVHWSASNQPSGLYLAQLECNGYAVMRKLTLVK